MIPAVAAVYDELVRRAALPPVGVRAQELRDRFRRRSGTFEPDHPAAEARDAAAWEEAIVGGGLARRLAPELTDPAERELAMRIAESQRGVFLVGPTAAGAAATDLWSGAVFLVHEEDRAAREMLWVANASTICQGRLVATTSGCVFLPGAIFHPSEAHAAIQRVLLAGRQRGLSTDDALDALLKMEHTLRTLARVKIAYAYRPEALP